MRKNFAMLKEDRGFYTADQHEGQAGRKPHQAFIEEKMLSLARMVDFLPIGSGEKVTSLA